jgi:UTP--glucose-1-phosphate uridylyltransferase
VFNSNSLGFSAGPLAELGRTLEGRLSFFPVRKEVGGEAVLQFERLVHELTFSAETTFLRVPRSGAGSRFLPVKNHEDLAASRDALLALAAERGMLREIP